MSLDMGNGVAPTKPARKSKVFTGCSRITDYSVIGKLGEGTFGEVHRAQNKKSGNIVALKKILMHHEKDGFPITALREIKLLKLLNHPNILKLEEMSIEQSQAKDKKKRSIMYMVTPYMDHDLSGLLDNPTVHFTEPIIKCYMLQLLEGMRYMHSQSILHRDIKAANILINNKGILQIADFGLARVYGDEVPRAGNGGGVARREYTPLVVTRWYRPPELLLHLRKYTTAVDMWGIGCVFGEMLVKKPILAGESDQRQLELIFELVGSPNEENWPGWTELPGAQGIRPRTLPSTLSSRFREFGPGAISLLSELLKLNFRKRSNAIDALKHPYFRNSPLPVEPGNVPMFEESHEIDRKNRAGAGRGPAPPPPPKGGTVGAGPGDGWTSNGNHGQNGGRNDYRNMDRYNGGRQPHGGHRDGPPPSYGPPGRRPAWERDGRPDNRVPDTRLPPRPPPPADPMPARGPSRYDGSHDYRSRGRDRPRDDREPYPIPPRSRGGDGMSGSRADVDTYIPAYRGGPEDGRRDDRDDRRRWDDRDDRGYGRAPGPPMRDRLDYGDDRGRGGLSRSRSKSPMRERDGRVRDREPLDSRDRDYRR